MIDTRSNTRHRGSRGLWRSRWADGCSTVTTNAATRTGRGFTFYVSAGAVAKFSVTNVTATWDTRAALGALEELVVDGLDMNDGLDVDDG